MTIIKILKHQKLECVKSKTRFIPLTNPKGNTTKTIMKIMATVIISSLLFSVYQPGNAVINYGHDGSLDNYLTKVKVEPYKGKQGFWIYLVKACATDHHMAVASVILKSDMAEKHLGVNKIVKKGDCSSYGAVMKAKDSKTLGAEIIERHEALDKFNQLLDSNSNLNKNQQQLRQKEITFYRIMLGGLV